MLYLCSRMHLIPSFGNNALQTNQCYPNNKSNNIRIYEI